MYMLLIYILKCAPAGMLRFCNYFTLGSSSLLNVGCCIISLNVITSVVLMLFTPGSVTLCLGGVSKEITFGRLFFGNDDRTIILNMFAISMNALVYAFPYDVKPGMFDLGFIRMLSMSAAVC